MDGRPPRRVEVAHMTIVVFEERLFPFGQSCMGKRSGKDWGTIHEPPPNHTLVRWGEVTIKNRINV